MQKSVVEYWWQNRGDASATAIVEDGKKVAFQELYDSSARLATHIIQAYSDTGVPIGVFLPKSSLAVIADMAILYSGNCYMNLDIKSPAERIRIMVEHVGPLFLLTTHDEEEVLRTAGVKVPIVYIDDVLASAEDGDASLIEARLAASVDTDPYCIINTSGSTGVPKGVVMSHRNVMDFFDNACRELSLTGEEVIGSLSPVYFDIYTLEFCLMLARKACMVLIPESLAIFPEKLVSFLEETRVNFIFWVPTIMVNIANLDILATHPLKNLQKVLFAGEVFPSKHLSYWYHHLPQATFINMYGPIEITVDCLYHVVNDTDIATGTLPIGQTFSNTSILILNDEGNMCGDNEPGELCVRGSSLALGYWHDAEKTARAFVQNPLNDCYPERIYRTGDIVYRRPDGNVMFVGRKDFQIKHFGYRIELPEIEAVAVGLDQIDNACVLYNQEGKQIILVYEAKKAVPPREIRESIGRILPKYMLPTVFHQVERMPRNPNGKIDRTRLKKTFVTKNEAEV